MALPVGQEGMDAEFMIDPAQCGIAEVFPQVIINAKPVGIVESKVNRGLLFLFFLIKLRYTFCEMSNRILILLFQFIEPADRFYGFLAGAFLNFIVISINNRKTDAAMRVRCFFVLKTN